MLKLCEFKFMQTAEFDEFTSQIVFIQKMSCQLSSNYSSLFRNLNRRRLSLHNKSYSYYISLFHLCHYNSSLCLYFQILDKCCALKIKLSKLRDSIKSKEKDFVEEKVNFIESRICAILICYNSSLLHE